jgi:2-octaprenyl-6-methoxyphenol hydroxylase
MFDVVCVGAGLVGRLVSILLAKKGIRVASIDHLSVDAIQDGASDGRTTAITLGSRFILEDAGIWQYIRPYAQAIQHIRVFEGGSPWSIEYDAHDIGTDPMGYIVENAHIRRALYADQHDALTLYAPSQVKSVQRDHKGVSITLDDGQVVNASLLIAADGRFSKMRHLTGITTSSWEYDQQALVVHMTHEKDHKSTAWEIFYPQGPLAVLPLLSSESGAFKSGLVWCKKRDHDWHQQSDHDLKCEFEELFPYYGSVSFLPKRWTYPLAAAKVNRLIDQRFALVGDAGHSVHPIAGQGVNLGWRDAHALANLLSEAHQLGLDMGDFPLLQRYDTARKTDRLSVLWSTDAIARLYGYSNPLLYGVRNAAFAMINRVSFVKKKIMRNAMGLSLFS